MKEHIWKKHDRLH